MPKIILPLFFGFLFSFYCEEIFSQVGEPFAELDTIIHVCDGQGGYVKFVLNGDPDSYNYYWLHGPVTLELDSLAPGSYTFVVIDFYGCVEVHEIDIEDLEGCQMDYQILYGRTECKAFIVLEVFTSPGGLPIDESSLIVTWEDDNPSGLKREIGLKEDSTYCVRIELAGLDTACCVIDTCIFVERNIRCKYSIQKSTVIVNEINRRESGAGQFVELLVVGNGVCGDSFDLRGYHLDDNNGYLIPGNSFVNSFSSYLIGADPGFLTFSFAPSWASVPNGSLIVIYDEGGEKETGMPADDPEDGDQDGVYVLMASDGEYLAGKTSHWDDSQGQWTFKGSLQPPAWELIALSPNADGMQVRYPDGGFDHGQSLGQTPFSAPNDFPVWITDASPLGYHCRFDKSDPFLKEDFTCTLAEEDAQSPGLPNSEMNGAHIDSLRNCGGHRGPVAQEAPPISTTATEEHFITPKLKNAIEAFPNPYRKGVTLRLNTSDGGEVRLKVFSVSGQLLAQQTIVCNKGENVFPLQDNHKLGAGLHILECLFPDGEKKYARLVQIEY